MVEIIIAVVAVILCTLASALWAAEQKVGLSIFFGTLAVINVVTLGFDISKYQTSKNGGLNKTVVEKVVDYNIDSTTTINGRDTSRTYTITYFTKD